MKTLYLKTSCEIIYSNIFLNIKLGEMFGKLFHESYLRVFLEKRSDQYLELSFELRGIPGTWPYLLTKYIQKKPGA